MFIQVPDSVNKSLRNGQVPKTQIHYPRTSFQLQDPGSTVWMDSSGIHESRNMFDGRHECSCAAEQVRPGWISWRPALIPTHEQHRLCREVYSSFPVLISPHSSPPRQSVVEQKMQNIEAIEEGVLTVKEDVHSEEDEIENLESPRSFASSGSSSSRDDALINLSPEMLSPRGAQTPVPRPRSQQVNPWGKASYSDLITMAITSTADNMMTLSDIYSWIVKNVPYFSDKGSYLSVQGWKVSQNREVKLMIYVVIRLDHA